MEVNYENIQAFLILLKAESKEILVDIESFKSDNTDNKYYKHRLKKFLKIYLEEDEELLKDLLAEDHILFEKIINLHYERMRIWIQEKLNYDDIDKEIDKPIVENDNSLKKNKFIRFNKIILPWLKNNDFFFQIYNENSEMLKELEDKPILNFDNNKEHIWRDNQTDAINHLEKNGLQTGIHCQATGCGKTYIILYYIGYMLMKIKNPIIILFTERVSILKDLFLFEEETSKPNENKIKEWKEKGICDLSNVDIVNRVIIKKKDWVDILITNKKPTLLVINRAFLTSDDKYTKLKNNNLHLVIHDECHNTASEKCHNFLLHCKSHKVPIVGFSATPIRANSKNEIPKLLEIYSDSKGKLNLLTDYNMIHSISKDLILPPEFFWYQIESYNKLKSDDEKSDEKISDLEVGSILDLLNEYVVLMPHKKFVAWCGTISLCKEWMKKFTKSCKERKNLNDFKFGIDTSDKNFTGGYEYFKNSPKNDKGDIIPENQLSSDDNRRMYYGKSILFCANKHREGSDISLLDGCIFLDKVKDRSPNIFIQSIGRVLRKCNINKDKNRGFIFDGVVKDSNYDKTISEKIIGYYLALQNLANVDSNLQVQNKLENFYKICELVKIDKNEIKLNIGKNCIKINCKQLEWKEIKNKFSSVLQTKIELTEEDKLRIDFDRLKKDVKDNDIVDKDDYRNKAVIFDWVKNPWEKYKSFWIDFYDFIGKETTNFPKDKTTWLEKCRKYKIDDIKMYPSQCYKYNLPDMPEEIYKDFSNYENEFNGNSFTRR
jgi:superfamily II DNA or RNA helicase